MRARLRRVVGSARLSLSVTMKRTLAAVAALLGFVLPLSVAAPAHAADGPSESRLIIFVNQQRAAAGLPALLVNARLTTGARAWSDHMTATGTLAEDPNLTANYPPDWSGAAENVGMGSTVDSIAAAMWSSPPHRANILGPYDALGVGLDRRGDGTLFVTIEFIRSSTTATYSSCGYAHGQVTPSPGTASGYRVLAPDGSLTTYGSAANLGSMPSAGAHGWGVMLATMPGGYWILDNLGGIFSFGAARYYGSLPGSGVHDTGVGLASTPSGRGYWVLGADGGVFAFGDAHYFGSLPGVGVRTTAIKLVPTPSGNGYWVLGADGGIFSFGDAHYFGSLPGLDLHDTGVSMAATPSGRGYWVLDQNGGVFTFGDAAFHGSVPGLRCSAVGVQLVRSADGNGYYVLSLDGQVFSFGDAPFLGQPAGSSTLALDLAITNG
jgi:hypothetical protein